MPAVTGSPTNRYSEGSKSQDAREIGGEEFCGA
jgi:hypothetical protein